MIGLVNGKEIRFRLDQIDENKVIGIKPGPDRIILSRSEISWMRFRPEVPKKIPAGQEGVLLSDSTVIIGSPIHMDEKYFWIEDSEFNRKRVEIKKVIFIQLANSTDAVRIPSASKDAITSHVRVDAAHDWTRVNLIVRPDQLIWFTVGDDSISYCSDSSEPATAAGIPNDSNMKLPVSDANVCSLIGKIGEQGKPFLIGFQRTPFVADSSDQLFLGINDSNFENNKGQFDVFIKIERKENSKKFVPQASCRHCNPSTSLQAWAQYLLHKNLFGVLLRVGKSNLPAGSQRYKLEGENASNYP
jgi:hypothetical protein